MSPQNPPLLETDRSIVELLDICRYGHWIRLTCEPLQRLSNGVPFWCNIAVFCYWSVEVVTSGYRSELDRLVLVVFGAGPITNISFIKKCQLIMSHRSLRVAKVGAACGRIEIDRTAPVIHRLESVNNGPSVHLIIGLVPYQ